MVVGLHLVESAHNKLRARKAVVVYIQNRGLKRFSDEMIKVSVAKTKRTGLLVRIIALILQILVPRRVYLATIKGVFHGQVPFNFVEVI